MNKDEVWLSLVERYVRDVEAAGSNPVTSTKKERATADSSFFFGGDTGREARLERSLLLSTVRPLAVVCHAEFESCHLDQQKQNICLPTNVLFLFIQAAGLVYHHDAVVDIIKGGEPPLYLITRQRVSTCGLMISSPTG